MPDSNQNITEHQPEIIQPIQWVEKVSRLNDLRPFEHNPRIITEAQFTRLKNSIIEFGQFKPLIVTHDLRLAGGHQRLKAMMELGFEEARISVPNRVLTDDEYMKLVLLDNHSNGVFDADVLANVFDFTMIQEVGLHEFMNIPPIEALQAEAAAPGKVEVKCPGCGHIFPTKGNKA